MDMPLFGSFRQFFRHQQDGPVPRREERADPVLPGLHERAFL